MKTNRRVFLRGIGGLAVTSVVGGCATTAPGDRPIVRFGLVTDVHFSDVRADSQMRDGAMARPYAESKRKLNEAVAVFNGRSPDFVIELGDFKDLSTDRESTMRCLDEIEGCFSMFRGPRYHVVGNHDFDCLSPEEFMSRVTNGGKPMTRGHYSFDVNGVRFLVLDACFDSNLRHYSRCNPWYDANLPPDELDWLECELTASPRHVVVFCHQRLDTSSRHAVRNAASVRAVLERSGKVVLVVTGHEHTGGFSIVNGIPYYTLHGLICGTGKMSNSYAEAAIFSDGSYSVTGWGNAVSRSSQEIQGG